MERKNSAIMPHDHSGGSNKIDEIGNNGNVINEAFTM